MSLASFKGETAELIARQIAIDLDPDGEERAVVVVNEAGFEIYKAPVKVWPLR